MRHASLRSRLLVMASRLVMLSEKLAAIDEA